MASAHDSDHDAIFSKDLRVYSSPTPSVFCALCAELEGLLIKLREMVLADARFLLDEDSGAGIYGVELDISIDESLTRARAVLARWSTPANNTREGD